jgi:nitrogen fixation NifU-like protein
MQQDRLLAEYRAPKNRREMPDATARAELMSPVCGDVITVMVRERNGCIADVSFTGQGCSIAVASASLLTQAVRGRTLREALVMSWDVDRMLDRATPGRVDLPELLSPLQGVAPFPGRHGCALMAWQALREALEPHQPR